jgi:hypothetical protein
VCGGGGYACARENNSADDRHMPVASIGISDGREGDRESSIHT